MKTLTTVLKWIVSLLLVLDILFWFALHASGHNVPEDTNSSVILSAIILVIVLILLYVVGKRAKIS